MKLIIFVASLTVFTANISANENALLKALNDPEIKNALFKSAEDTLQSMVPETLGELQPLVERSFGFLKFGQLDPGSRGVIIPPGLLPELIPLPSVELIDINLLDGLLIGNLSFSNVELLGLHTLTDTLEVESTTEPLAMNLTYEIILPWLSLNSDYKADLELNIGAITPIEGGGYSNLTLKNTALKIDLHVTVKPETVDRVRFTTNLTFEAPILDLFFENLLVGNTPIDDWEPLSETLRINLESLVQVILDTPEVGQTISNILEVLTEGCSIHELIDFFEGIDGSDLTCIPLFRPTPTTSTTPVTTSTRVTTSTTPATASTTTPAVSTTVAGASSITNFNLNILILKLLTISGVLLAY